VTVTDDKAHFVRGMFDSIASRYDLMNRLMTGWQDERWRRLAADAVYPETVSVALDVGAGTGDLSLALARKAPQARVLAADFSAGMLRHAQPKLATDAAGTHVQPLQGDAMQLPVGDASVDAVVTGFVMRNVADLPTVLAEFARVLRPGGRLAILELTPVRRSPVPGFGRAFDLYFSGVVPLLGGLVSGRGFAYRYLPSSVKIFPDAPTLADMLRTAGLGSVEYKLLALGTLALHTATKPTSPTVGGTNEDATDTMGRGDVARGLVPRQTLSQREIHSPIEWNETLAQVQNSHILQSWEWAELKRETGWTPRRFVFERDGNPVAAASVSRRPVPGTPFGIAYCQKGPAMDFSDTALFREVLDRLAEHARAERCIFLKVDPDVEATQPGGVATLREAGYVPAAEQVQTRSTVINELQGDDKELLGQMSSSWRRYVNKAQKDGVVIRTGTAADLPRFYELTKETGERDRFIIRPFEYYRSAFERLTQAGLAELFLAEVDGSVEVALLACALGKRAWYLWGASSQKGQEARAAYLIQWHTMQWARERGCESYDMWGAPDDPNDKDDPLSGVYYFKRGFGGRHVRMAGVYDYVVNPALYALWERALPQYMGLLRRMRGERPSQRGAAHA
jgi:peptidoglycan pentaglycine glycine transferase (the first glycine)